MRLTRALLVVLLVVSGRSLAQPSMGPIDSSVGACLDVAPDSLHAETAPALTLSLDRSRRAVLESGARRIQTELAKVLFDRLSGE
jgi:hypothetical protein